jgi:hypothetical protein
VDKKSGQRVIDHGIDLNTDEIVIMPNLPISYFDSIKHDIDVGEYVIYNN